MAKTVRCTRRQYKCRKCGQIFRASDFYDQFGDVLSQISNLNTTDAQNDLIDRISGRRPNLDDPFRHARVNLFLLHRCKDDDFGLADFIGIEKSVELPLRRNRIVQPETKKEGGA